MLFEEFAALFQKDKVHFLHREIRRDQTRTAVVGIRVLRQLRFVKRAGGRHRNAIVFDESVEPVGGGTARRAEEAVEAVVHRPAIDAAREVHAPDGFHAVATDGLAVLIEECQTDVPLADARRGIAVGPEHGRQREPPGRNERRPADTLENPAAIRHAEGHLARHQTVTRGRANGGRTVGIGEAHPFACEPIQVGRGDFGPFIVAAHVAEAKIIGEDDHKVGLAVGGVQRNRQGQRGKEPAGGATAESTGGERSHGVWMALTRANFLGAAPCGMVTVMVSKPPLLLTV